MINMELSHSLDIQQTLEMMLSPRMLQMLKVLNLSYADLVEEITQKTEENVMLELEKPDRLFEYLKAISTEKIPGSKLVGEELPGVEALADTHEDLSSHLLDQIKLEDLSDTEERIAELMIDGLDEHGYIKDYPALCDVIQKELDVTQGEIDDVLEIVQALEPEGVAARSLKECLLIQINEYNFDSPQLKEILKKAVDKHLEDFADRDLDKVAKSLKITAEGAASLAEFIKKNLNPDPASIYNTASPCVVPSFFIKKEKGKYIAVNLEKQYGPVIKISAQYEKMLNDPKTDAKTMEFLKARLYAAKDFLENINKRHETIAKIMDRIVGTQEDFFEGTQLQMKPLMQKDIADELGLHPSTISRAISNKYIQTPKGVFRLKFLCPRDIKGMTSSQISKLVEEAISSESSASPATDDKIVEKLAEKGINIKRRTVASYRKKLGIGPTAKRVKF
jgi:RNA polymerase sigma-54 factor